MQVSIIGASGYAGLELVKILGNHPHCCLSHLLAHRSAGKSLADIFPFTASWGQWLIEDLEDEAYLADSDVVFIALPHGKSALLAEKILAAGKKVVDLGADFRFRDSAVYEEWYQPHPCKALCSAAAYGLPELYRRKIARKNFVANPGCYPTGATLALYPLIKEKAVDCHSIIIDSKSGISGAGRGLKEGSLYCEAGENMKAYSVAAHRHTPEIEQNYSEARGKAVKVSFTPHLTPMSRGILTTAYANLAKELSLSDVAEIFQQYYGQEHFIRLLPCCVWPETKWVQGTNFVFLGFTVDMRTNRVIVVTALDNLVKGAAGQAVQNFNLMCGFEENCGLEMLPLFP